MFNMFRGIIVVSAVLIIQELGAAEIKHIDAGFTEMIEIKGEIEKGDYSKMISIIKEIGHIPKSIKIDSLGGDVLEAITIGQFARRALITVYSTNNCNSSCFIILAGGVNRRAYAPVGIHRPIYGKSYFSGLTYEGAQKEYEKLNNIVREYLLEMDVPVDIIDKMMSTPNERVFMWNGWKANVTLDKKGGHAPAYHEWISAKCGTLSKQEDKDYSTMMAVQLLEAFGKMDEYKNTKLLEEYRSMSEGYREYIWKQVREINACEIETTAIEREKIYNSLN